MGALLQDRSMGAHGALPSSGKGSSPPWLDFNRRCCSPGCRRRESAGRAGRGHQQGPPGTPQSRLVGVQGLAGVGLTVEGGEGHRWLAAEVIVFIVGVGVGVLGRGRWWLWGGEMEMGQPPPARTSCPTAPSVGTPMPSQPYLALWQGWGASSCTRWRWQRAHWGSGCCGPPALVQPDPRRA